MWRLALWTLRFRKGGFIATFVAIGLGTAVVLACAGLMETGIRTAVPPQRLGSAAVVLAGDQSYRVPGTDESATLAERVRLPNDLVDVIDDVPGVDEAVGDRAFPVTVLGVGAGGASGLTTIGHGWSSSRLAPYRLGAGHEPARFGEVALDATLARRAGATVGDRLDLWIHGETRSYRVAGITLPPVPMSQTAVFFSDGQARLLSGHPDGFDAIGVLTGRTDTDALEASIDDALHGRPIVTLTGSQRGLAEFPDARTGGETLIVLSAVFGGLAILVAMLVVGGTLGLSIQLRRRELALLRAIGATPGQVRRLIIGETMVVSVAATTLGCLAGLRLGPWLFERIAEHGVISPALEYRQGWIPAAAAAGVALLSALTVGAVAGRGAIRAHPIEALGETDLPRRWLTPARLILAMLFLAGGAALAIVTAVMNGPIAASTAAPTVMLWAIGFALLAPGVTRPTIALLRWPMRAVPGPARYLATHNTRQGTVRVAGVIVPIMLATGVATALLYLQTTESRAAERGYARGLRADVVLTSASGAIPPNAVPAVREVPQVAAASAFVSSTGFVEVPHDDSQGEDGWPLWGISPDGASQTMPVAPRAGTLGALRGDSVALPIDLARELDRGIGDTITIRLGDGVRSAFRIVALLAANPGYGSIVLPADTLAAHTTSGSPSQVLVRADTGADPDALVASLKRLSAGWPGVEVADRSAALAR